MTGAVSEANGVLRTRTPDGAPVWVVTGYDDVRDGLADPRLSLNKANSGGTGYRGFALPPALDANLLNMDPPDHTRLRKLVSAAFTARRVADLRPRVEAIAAGLLDRLPASPDLVRDFAAPLPLTVIGELLGVPGKAAVEFRDWTNVLLNQPLRAVEAIAGMEAFLVALIASKRAEPGDDLVSAMIAARDDGDRLTEDELVSLAFLIFWAGYENSVHLIANAVLELIQRPDRRGDALDELIRDANPNPYAIRRFPLQDLDISGTTIPAGDTVLLDIGSANRERDRPHLSFGHGVHHCLGAPLARLELEVALDAVFRRFPRVALTEDAADLPWRESLRSRGVLRLPVAVNPL